jgi:hypothetical protein
MASRRSWRRLSPAHECLSPADTREASFLKSLSKVTTMLVMPPPIPLEGDRRQHVLTAERRILPEYRLDGAAGLVELPDDRGGYPGALDRGGTAQHIPVTVDLADVLGISLAKPGGRFLHLVGDGLHLDRERRLSRLPGCAPAAGLGGIEEQLASSHIEAQGRPGRIVALPQPLTELPQLPGGYAMLLAQAGYDPKADEVAGRLFRIVWRDWPGHRPEWTYSSLVSMPCAQYALRK